MALFYCLNNCSPIGTAASSNSLPFDCWRIGGICKNIEIVVIYVRASYMYDAICCFRAINSVQGDVRVAQSPKREVTELPVKIPPSAPVDS